ncbi:MAG: prepilin peptidase [Rhodopila sp.]|nr:prepilin peptidase [Rhodopila sp.]
MAGSFDAAWLLPILAAPFVGSFLGVLIVRLPDRTPIVLARSACPHCGTRLSAIDLIPLASFLLLRGRCRHCRHPIGLFHPMVELAAVAVALWTALAVPDPGRIWAGCGLGWTLLTLAWIDWTRFLLPDVLTLPLLLAGLALTSVWEPEALTDRCLAAVLAYSSFQGVAVVYRRLRGRDGLGGGDAKLIAAAGAWCGLAALPFVVLASAVLGLLAALGLALAGRDMTSRTPIPFGPCIALAFWLAWLHGGLAADLAQVLGRL